MSLKESIPPFIDGNKLVAPNWVDPGTIRASDNGTMFTSEYIIMLNRTSDISPQDIVNYDLVIKSCVGSDGCLHRAPGDTSPDVIDNNLGVLAGYAEFGKKVPFSLPFALWRFPQLVYAYLLNKGVPSLVMAPLALISALIIATSGWSTPTNNADARRLNWDLLQATKRKSLLARIAGYIWHRRQASLYGTNEVMKAVASFYYRDKHPFISYWVD